MEKQSEEFISRPYQIDLYERALKSNTILYLPTGSGKTFVAMMLIKKLSGDVQNCSELRELVFALREGDILLGYTQKLIQDATQKRPNFKIKRNVKQCCHLKDVIAWMESSERCTRPYSEGGKRTIFTVNTVPLVTQQSEYVARHTGLSCRGYCGDMNVDFWTKEIWLEELEKYQVLVMTSQIFLDIISHGCLSLNRVNLILFDECHRGVNDHPMRQIMQRFKEYPKDEQPKILALSATLLNSNVKLQNVIESIKSLEITFQSKITTVDNVRGYSTNPKEVVICYEAYVQPESWLNAIKNLDYLLALLNHITISKSLETNASSEVFKPKSTNVKLKALILDVIEHCDIAGLYGVHQCLLLHIIQLECKKKYTSDETTIYVLEYIITEFTKLRKFLHDEMKDYTDREKIFKFSADRVLKLLTLLKNFNDDKLPEQKFCCIIFVKRRFTATVLYHILKDLSTFDERYKFVCPDYIVGYSNNPYKNSKEVLCISKWNSEVLHRFRNGLSNCVIATEVLDEGIDIPACTLVVRFDLPLDFRSYIQSKGRARYATSQFVIMLNKNDHEYIKRQKLYKDINSYLENILVGNTDLREVPTEKEIEDTLYQYKIEPYKITRNDGTQCILTENAAISLLNKYSNMLLKSKFSILAPTWKLHKLNNENTMYQVFLTLPIISPLREIIIGDPMPSIMLAKRSAAFKTCVKLYKIGELTDDLLPCPNIISQDTDYLFPNWIDEDKAAHPGTYRKRRYHQLKYPEPLYGAFPSEGKTLYLHIICVKPVYSIPQDNRNLVFYNLLQDNAGFAILSTKTIPTIPSFPIFMNVGELNVNIEVNHKEMTLTAEEIMKLRIFHTMIFRKIVPVIKHFMTFDKSNLDNCFLVVPTDAKNDINWSVINEHGHIKHLSFMSELMNTNYELSLVVPNYRSSNVYVVTQVCDDITPNSCFPTDDFVTYAHYYEQKHELKIYNLSQPMLEVKAISTHINCIAPRSMTSGLSKRKRADVLEDHDEHLVPELCQKVEFPALYWLKATTLPSILHRISQLLIALDLRDTIVKEACLGTLAHELDDNHWSPLVINVTESEEQLEPLLEARLDDTVPIVQPVPDLSGPEIDVLNTDANLYPWSKEQEPPDLNRNAKHIQLIDIEYYCHFMKDTSNSKMLPKKSTMVKFKNRPKIIVPSLHFLEIKDKSGPEPIQIMQALITKGNDIFDLERLETLGDSYLKCIISLYLYCSFPTYNEGRLTALKGKLIGNRNLYYCGVNKSIPGRMKVDKFIPLSTFICPAYTTFRPLQSILLDAEVSPNVLYELYIPEEEILSGYLSENTQKEMERRILDWDAEESQTGIEHFIGVQTVPDKVVADCVEALIGVYLKSMGLEGATKLLMWFGVLPNYTNIEKLLYGTPQKPEINSGDPNIHMPWATAMEQKLDYKFKNRAFLLQAFTHPSFTANGITDCYQRLEFLGDAIIDFLITGYIYENCGDLNPGELTDLRSALVNNITFACLAVKYGLHTALLAYAPTLNDVIDRFVKFQEERNFIVDDEVLIILLEEEECNMSEYVDVPKILGDLFESLIGAIYLDSNKDIRQVWTILYTLMQTEIDTFSKNVPKQPVRVIHETPGANPKFLPTTLIEGTNTIMVPLEITNKRKSKLFYGFGMNSKQAKCAAAKQALKYLHYKNE